MIIVSKLADYAVVLAVQLGHVGQKIGPLAGLTQVSTADLAGMTKLPGATVAKVLKALNRAGIVSAARGAGGGYRLAQDPADLTVADVIAAIDGPLGMTECAGEAGHEACAHMSYCVARPHWTRVTLAVRAALGAVTIEDMMPPPFTVAAPVSCTAPSLTLGADAS